MPLKIVATPIGHPRDVSERALQALRRCEILIGEERRETLRLLKRYDIPEPPEIYYLNEHSRPEDIREMASLCEKKEVALICDGGTPGFCDPGAHLVALCRKNKVAVQSLPGPSALTLLISLSSERIKEFVFRGFPPAAKDERVSYLQGLSSEKRPQILMDTPYRLEKLLQELSLIMPERKALLAMDLTLESEEVLEGTVNQLSKGKALGKREFMLLLYAI